MYLIRSGIVAILCILGLDAFPQIRHPRASPKAMLTQTIGMSEVTVEYSRPTTQGRQIMGNLVPYGRIWRVGANESTKITFRDSVNISGSSLPPGTYALYAIPEEREWTIIIHKNISHWGDGRRAYKPEEDALRFKVIPDKSYAFADALTLSIDPVNHQEGVISIRWETVRVQFSLRFETRKAMMLEITNQVRLNPTAATYYESARYFQEERIYPERAREYLIKAQQLAGDQYYIHRVWALVEAQLANYPEAIRHGELSRVLAAKEGKDEFVRMNEKDISEWIRFSNTKD